MTIDETKVTTFATICVILLRGVRQERGIHQAQVADWLGKTASAWTKIEAGKSPLQFDVFVRVCNVMGLFPSFVMGCGRTLRRRVEQQLERTLGRALDGTRRR